MTLKKKEKTRFLRHLTSSFPSHSPYPRHNSSKFLFPSWNFHFSACALRDLFLSVLYHPCHISLRVVFSSRDFLFSLFTYLFKSLIHRFIYSFINLFICSCIHQSVYLLVCISISLSIYLSTYLRPSFNHLLIYLFITLSVLRLFIIIIFGRTNSHDSFNNPVFIFHNCFSFTL